MKKLPKFTKEWLELTLCDMLDEISQMANEGQDNTEIMKVIKKYSAEIYNLQNDDKK